MNEPERNVAYYHLPGLFEFYELYRIFLPLFRRHREYFYEWCDIGSIYGAPADCLWGGGRVGTGECDADRALALAREIDLPMLKTPYTMFEACARLYTAGLRPVELG